MGDADYERALARQKAWVSEDELAALGLERATGFKSADNGKPESPVEQANRMMRENAPMAAASLIKLAQNGDSETVRLRASIEILNRATAQGAASDGREPWADVYEKVMTTKVVEDFANGKLSLEPPSGEWTP
jgi:hypothetical protein